jgi:hypothetical protein
VPTAYTSRNSRCGEPVEKAFAPRQLRDQHHAGQEQIDVDALAHPGERI